MALQTAEQTNININMREAVDAMNVLLGVLGRMYMHYANSVIDAAGQPGEMTVRHHLRQFGHFRGTEMREAHHALGKPIDMASLTCFWDNASTYVIHDDMEAGKYTPHDSAFDVHFCPASLAWKESGFHRWGHAYCDEFHQACASTYHPDGNVVIPINMMKGDDHCAFRWIMPADARTLEFGEPTALGRRLAKTYEETTTEEGALNAMRRTSRLVGGCYITMVRPLLERHSLAEARQMQRDFLHLWSRDRGERMRAEHASRGLQPTPANFLRGMDFCTKYVWDIQEISVTPNRHEAVIHSTPMDQAWQDYDLVEDARIFWEESYPALAAGYDPSLRVELPKLNWRGDAETVVKVSRI